MNRNITANHILLAEVRKNEILHDESVEMIIQRRSHAPHKFWQKIELRSTDNLRETKYPWCSDSADHISSVLKRNRERNGSGLALIAILQLIAANLRQNLNLFSAVKFFDLHHGQNSDWKWLWLF